MIIITIIIGFCIRSHLHCEALYQGLSFVCVFFFKKSPVLSLYVKVEEICSRTFIFMTLQYNCCHAVWISRILVRFVSPSCFWEADNFSADVGFSEYSVSNWQYFCWQRRALKGPSPLFWQRKTTKTIYCLSAIFQMLAVKMTDGERRKKLNATSATKLV